MFVLQSCINGFHKYVYAYEVTMQAQREPPPDMICKDKFLVQGATVPEGTTEEDITSEMVSGHYYYY